MARRRRHRSVVSGGMPEVLIQILGLIVIVLPLAATQWNLAGHRRRRRRLVMAATGRRWRLEIYSNDHDVERSLADWADIPFPVKLVRSAKGELASSDDTRAWALPRLELEVDVDDPFTDDVLSGLFGVDHHVRFVSGDEAVVDAGNGRRVRVRALAFR